ncbi:CRISPR-associated Cas6 family protein [Haloferax mucosum ATCC BAA-1512]|uniref:CRISPR-associated Cas6 family protein n=1 Tax=Haloferax mucosum ATCC BAA-1512 TaxID=662479 RepID=M0IC75_9EURY|nr:CRISPR-associated endoribonuclease Cas6 [Haloferax mucosum]ELZ93657.1 CRISPR-associated Cas6 family protein [Haloferax mucosum ATCC BAA-1512]
MWRALEGSKFDREHDNGHPLGLAFSNIFPWGEIRAGDRRSVLFASPREDLLATIARDLQQDRAFNIGEMSFEVDELSQLSVDVGEPGTRGVIETATGVVVRILPEHRERYGIETDYDTATYWRPEHTIRPFKEAIQANLQHKHDRFAHEYQDGPTDVDGDLFEGYDLLKTYALPVTVTTGTTIDLLLSKWRFDYRVRSDSHRRHLNLALDTGLGGRNGLGFGFSNIVEKTAPSESQLEGADALT